MDFETFKVFGLDNRVEEIWLGDRDHLSQHHCKRCGSRIVEYDGDPHNVAQCPVCRMYPSSVCDYSDAEQINEIEKQIINLTDQLNRQVNLLKIVKGLNRIREKNLNDTAMKEKNV